MNQDSRLEYFKKLLAKNSLGHAYIFWGEAAKKSNFAEKITALWDPKMLETAVIETNKSEFIGIDKAKFAKQFLFKKPVYAERRAIIIKEMNKMTPEAQNSLLKLAEETPGSGIIIGTLSEIESILPTLSSRFSKIYLGNAPKIEKDKKDLKIADDFLKNKAMRHPIIEKISKTGEEFALLEALLIILKRDIISNWRKAKFVNERICLMRQYQTNKKLQLKAIAAYI